MAARTKSHKLTVQQRKNSKEMVKKIEAGKQEKKAEHDVVVAEHLPPWMLTVAVLVCSGMMLVLCLRDFWTTGKNIAGGWDEALLVYTKSTDWFEDSKGWKSTQGGFSAIQPVSTDENNMGGFFVRKLAGGAGCAVQLHKILPLVWHEPGAQWTSGHFQPWLVTAVIGNMAVAVFLASYLEDLKSAGAHQLPIVILSVLGVETFAMLFYLYKSRKTSSYKRLPAVALPEGKTPTSLVSNILTRTMAIVTTVITVVAARDLFFPGSIIALIPRDDIYLEWTNAFLHSPPANSQEAIEFGLEAPLYIGDKFVSQLAAVNILILSLYKLVTAAVIRYGADGSGTPKARMIWKSAFFGDVAMLMCFRFFAHSARSASYDTRCHLCLVAYEAFMIGLYAFI